MRTIVFASAPFRRISATMTSCFSVKLFEERYGVTVTPYIEELEIATPWTMCNYVNTPEGSAYGFELKDWDNMMPRMMMMGTEFMNVLVSDITHVPSGENAGFTTL